MASEILSKRSERGKHFDLGDGKRQFVGYTAPVHYKNGLGIWEDIVLDFKDDLLGNYLTDKNKVSCGFRKDGKVDKYFGLRYDAEHQFEATVSSVVLDGVEQVGSVSFISAPEVINPQLIVNKLNANVEILNRLNEVSLRNYYRIINPIENFKITEQLHLAGLTCSNKKIGKVYVPDAQNRF